VACTQEIATVTYDKLADEVMAGSRILLDDGRVEMVVDSVDKPEQTLYCTVTVGGVLSNNKGVNFPDVQLSIRALTDKDRTDLAFGLQQGVDWVALSFVRNPSDMQEIKELIATRVRPAVANDGGDIIFKRFDKDTGIVYLAMRGACSGCPSSAMTLKSGVENLLRHYVPEVTAVEAAA
jgi:Fe-S cluster biogenesis protein NfuA